MEDNNIQDSCCNSKYASIRQMDKLNEMLGRRFPFYPRTVIQAVHDGRTGASLEAILAQYNNIYVQYQGTAGRTRNIVPKEMRRKGIIISYVDMQGNAITEKCVNDAQRDNFHWGLDVNWVRVDELTLSGDISVSVKGTWVINGEDTGIAALGPKGDNGLTPWLKTIDNKLHFSYDNETWEVCSDYIAAYFRFQDNKFQISRDNKTWSDLSGEVTNSLSIKAYVTDKSQYLNPKQGDMIMVGPTYADDDAEHTKPIYHLNIYNAGGWVDHGPFQSINAGVVQELGDSETEVMSQKAVSEKFSELSQKCIYVGMHTNPAEITISAKTESANCRFTINIPDWCYIDTESLEINDRLSVDVTDNGMNRFYINKETKELLVKRFDRTLWESGYWLFLGFAYIDINQGTMNKFMFFGRYKYNGDVYYNSTKYVYDIGIPCPQMIFGMWSIIPNFTLSESVLSCDSFGLVMCTNGNSFYNSLPALNLSIDVSLYGDSTIIIYDINTQSYHQINYFGDIDSFKKGYYIVGFLKGNKEFYANGIYIFNGIEKQYAGLSAKSALMKFSYKTAIIGIDTDIAEITTNKVNESYLFSINIPRFIYIDNKCINVGRTYTKEIPLDKTGLYRLYIKEDLTDILLSAYNEENIKLGYIFIGAFNLETNGTINKPFFFGKVKINGVEYSSFSEAQTQSEVDKSISVSEADMQMFVYPKLYLIDKDKYTIQKGSIYYDKKSVDFTPYAGKDTFQFDRTELVAVTDMEISKGSSCASFEAKNIKGIQSSDNINDKYVGIYIESENTQQWVSGGKINTYGVRCKAIISDANGKSKSYTAIGDSQTHNGQVSNTKYYLSGFGMTLNGIGLVDNNKSGDKGEGRSGWRYENLVGRSNAMGWGAIEVITPNGSQKNTTDLLHNNPFLKLATDEEKRLHPTRCYTFTASSQETANYLEKSYQDIVNEGGDFLQNFYIYDIANYYKVQHDWNGEGNPVDAISFAFSTNEFIIEGYTEDVVTRLLDNLGWVLDRTREQLPNVKIAVIPCPAWSYGTNKNKYYTFILPIYFKRICEFIDDYNSSNSSDIAILQPHIFMDMAYGYTKGSATPVSIEGNESMIKKYTGTDVIHFGTINYQMYAKAIGGWLANL